MRFVADEDVSRVEISVPGNPPLLTGVKDPQYALNDSEQETSLDALLAPKMLLQILAGGDVVPNRVLA